MRRAIVEVTAECLRDCVGPLSDHGLEVVGCLESAPGHLVLPLVIEGDALPDECEIRAGSASHVVQVVFTQQAYGRQRLVQVSEIRLTGRTAIDIAVRRLRAA